MTAWYPTDELERLELAHDFWAAHRGDNPADVPHLADFECRAHGAINCSDPGCWPTSCSVENCTDAAVVRDTATGDGYCLEHGARWVTT